MVGLIFVNSVIVNNRLIGQVGRVFAMVRETWVQSQVASYQKTLKWYSDTSLLNTQQYKVCIKSKVEQSRKRNCTLPYTMVW